MPSTNWHQTNEQLTLRLALPAVATHECVRLILKQRRLSLLYAPDGKQPARVLLRRRLAAAVDPQRTPGYAIHDGQLVVVLHKVRPGGWERLFAPAPSSTGVQTSPGRTASHVLGAAATRAVAARAPERCCGARAATRHAWRSPVRCLPSMQEACADALPPGGRRQPQAEEEAKEAKEAKEAEEDDEGAEGAEEEADYPLPGSRAGCDTCGREVPYYGCVLLTLPYWLRLRDTRCGYTHYDDTHHQVRRYHHCVACGEDEGFDLCTRCYRAGARAP